MRRDEGHLRAIFGTPHTGNPEAGNIAKNSFRAALVQLDVDAANGQAFDGIFLEFDLDRDGQIDFEEFKTTRRQ